MVCRYFAETGILYQKSKILACLIKAMMNSGKKWTFKKLSNLGNILRFAKKVTDSLQLIILQNSRNDSHDAHYG